MMIIRGLSHGIVEDDELQQGRCHLIGVAMPGLFHYPLPRVFLKREEK